MSSFSSATTTSALRDFVNRRAEYEASRSVVDPLQLIVGNRLDKFLAQELPPEVVMSIVKAVLPPEGQSRKTEKSVTLLKFDTTDVDEKKQEEFALFGRRSETDSSGRYTVSAVSKKRETQYHVPVKRALHSTLELELKAKREKGNDENIMFSMCRVIRDASRNEYESINGWRLHGTYQYSQKKPFVLPLYKFTAQDYSIVKRFTVKGNFKWEQIVDIINNEVENAYDAMAEHIAKRKCQNRVTMDTLAVTTTTQQVILNKVPALCGLKTMHNGCIFCEQCKNAERAEGVLKRVAKLRAAKRRKRSR